MGTINTKFLHYQKLPRSFFAEISDLPGNRIPLTPLGDNLQDGIGFDLISQNTGASITMRATRTEFDKAGKEIVAYIFEPVDKNENRVTQVVLIND